MLKGPLHSDFFLIGERMQTGPLNFIPLFLGALPGSKLHRLPMIGITYSCTQKWLPHSLSIVSSPFKPANF